MRFLYLLIVGFSLNFLSAQIQLQETHDSFGSSMATAANMAVIGARLEGNGKAYFASEATLENQQFSKSIVQVYPRNQSGKPQRRIVSGCSDLSRWRANL